MKVKLFWGADRVYGLAHLGFLVGDVSQRGFTRFNRCDEHLSSANEWPG
jgi:hypothetical protein